MACPSRPAISLCFSPPLLRWAWGQSAQRTAAPRREVSPSPPGKDLPTSIITHDFLGASPNGSSWEESLGENRKKIHSVHVKLKLHIPRNPSPPAQPPGSRGNGAVRGSTSLTRSASPTGPYGPVKHGVLSNYSPPAINSGANGNIPTTSHHIYDPTHVTALTSATKGSERMFWSHLGLPPRK